MSTKICNHCNTEKDESEFNWRYKTLGVKNKACKDCQHGFNKTYYEGDAKERHLQKVKERTEAAREAAREHGNGPQKLDTTLRGRIENQERGPGCQRNEGTLVQSSRRTWYWN